MSFAKPNTQDEGKDLCVHTTRIHPDTETVLVDLSKFPRIKKTNFPTLIQRIDAIICSVRSKYITMVVLFDNKRTPMKIASFHTWRKLVSCLLDNYPFLLYKCYLINAPKPYIALYTMLKPFIDKETQDKVVFNKSISLSG